MKTEQPPARKTGRPLSFDPDAALEKAMHAFWTSGYETTSLSDLTTAMGVTAPSLYAAFGNKQQLFLAAMRRYIGDPDTRLQAFAQAPSARHAVADMLRAAAILYTGDSTPPGCLLASAAATGSADAADVRAAIAAERHTTRDMIMNRIAADISNGTLISQTPTMVLADLAMAVLQGMSVQARDGADRERLLAVADAATACWGRYETAASAHTKL